MELKKTRNDVLLLKTVDIFFQRIKEFKHRNEQNDMMRNHILIS